MTTIENAGATPMSASFRRILSWLHLWVGLIFCIPFAILGITGSVLVYEEPINNFLSPPPHASAEGEIRSVREIVDAAVAARGGAAPLLMTLPSEPGEAAIVRFSGAEGTGRGRRGIVQTYVDPVSLEILGTRSLARNFWLGLAHDLHGNMLWGGRQGRALVGWFGIGMLALGLSGIVMWWPRKSWRGAFGVSRNARGWLLHRQLHGTAGIAGWLLFVILSFSGVAISFPQTTTAFVRTSLGLGDSALPAPGPQSLSIVPVPGASLISADEAIALARNAVPSARVASIFFPVREDQPLRVNLIGQGAIAGGPAIAVSIDPYRAETIAVRDPFGGDFGDNVMTWQRPLHAGRGMSELYKLAIFVVGLLPPLFAVTGVAMWWIKRRRRTKPAAQMAGLAGVPAE